MLSTCGCRGFDGFMTVMPSLVVIGDAKRSGDRWFMMTRRGIAPETAPVQQIVVVSHPKWLRCDGSSTLCIRNGFDATVRRRFASEMASMRQFVDASHPKWLRCDGSSSLCIDLRLRCDCHPSFYAGEQLPCHDRS